MNPCSLLTVALRKQPPVLYSQYLLTPVNNLIFDPSVWPIRLKSTEEYLSRNFASGGECGEIEQSL